jgi:hypothetical protein
VEKWREVGRSGREEKKCEGSIKSKENKLDFTSLPPRFALFLGTRKKKIP